MRRKFLLVFNPIAGVAGRRLIDRVTEALESRGATVVRAKPGNGGADLTILDSESFDAAIAAGGDGTFRALAKALGTRLPIGFLPMGTGNVLAHEIGQPWGPAALADLYMRGPDIRIEGGLANGEPFFLMAGAGFDGDVIARLDTGLKRRIGKAAYVGPVLGALSCAPSAFTIEIDGVSHRAGWIVVAKARRYGGSFVIAPDAGIQNDGLVAVLFKSESRLKLIRHLLALGAGLTRADPGIAFIRCRHVRITAGTSKPVEIDGDPFDTTPLEVVAGGPAARLIVPAEFANSRPPRD